MRILHISEVGTGGVVELIKQYVAHQVQSGDSVAVAGPAPLEDAAANTYYPWQGSRARPHRAMRDIHSLRDIVRDFSPDVVHLHSFFAGLYGRIPRVTSAPICYQPHSWSFNALPSPMARAAVRGVEKAAARRTAVLITNCRDEAQEGRDHGVRIRGQESIGVCADLAHFRPPTREERDSARRRLGLPATEQVYLLNGRLCRQKGQDVLLPAWEADPPPNARLCLVGSGSPGDLPSLAPREWGRSIRYYGHAEAMRDWYHASDVMIMPSRYEGQSVAVSEALACGLPVVTFSVNGAEEMIVDGELPPAGAVVSQGDPELLLREARRRTEDRDLRGRESEGGRRRAELLSDPRRVLARLDAAYREALL